VIPPIKNRKVILIIAIVILATCFFGNAFLQSHKAEVMFYELSFSGRVLDKRIVSRGFTSVKLKNDDWQHLGIYYDDEIIKIKIGDSISKQRNTFNIFLFSIDGTITNCTRERYRDKTLDRIK
jgi:hypothetical protein